jgi:putative DNA methylase
MLRSVLAECHRVLKPAGTLAFTFHHSRDAAWIAVASAIEGAGFEVVAAHPVKAEMSVGVPKNQAREPIDLDLVIVAKKRRLVAEVKVDKLPGEPGQEAELMVRRYNQTATRLSRGDIRVILMGAFLRAHSNRPSADPAALIGQFTSQIERLYEGQDVSSGTGEGHEEQLSFSFEAT